MAKNNQTNSRNRAERDSEPLQNTPQATAEATLDPVSPGSDDASPPATATETAAEEVDAAETDKFAELTVPQLIEQLQQTQADSAQMKDGLLRAKAEIENIRRRSQKEMVAARKFAIEGFAQELLGVRDSLERASMVELDAKSDAAVRQMKEGLELTMKQFDIVMAKFSVVEVEADPGTRFDPQCHQAISTAPSQEFATDHIIAVVQKGFFLKERLLRPAMVVVASEA